ncbi:3-hydroxyacyl-ACP dehydratase [Vibrio sp.]|uniref:ApeI family dehydratase n=1 Tax=Vibrio sp. TaxID=678 RepID=UPI003D0BA16A
MQKRKPTLITSEVAQDHASLRLHVDSDLYDFQGHFSHFPLLPGVTQIDWALYYAVAKLGVPDQFNGMEVIKFQEPILPGAEITLTLDWDQDKLKLSFRYTSQRGDQQVVHSSGKMKLSGAGD